MTALSDLIGGGSVSDKYTTPVQDVKGNNSSTVWATVSNITAGEGFVDSITVNHTNTSYTQPYFRDIQKVRITIDGGAAVTVDGTSPSPYYYTTAGLIVLAENLHYKTSLLVEYLVESASTADRGVCRVNRRY